MQLFSRAEASGSSFGALASSLSLAIANYKPVPQLPSTDQIARLAHTVQKSASTGSTVTTQQTFQTKTATSTAADNSVLDGTADWGQASVLYVEKDTPNSRVASKAGTVGPGKCPIQSEYTPVGGWAALPAPAFDDFDPVMANVYRYRQQQGVNLGAWFAQEGWMENSFFSCAGGNSSAEYDILLGFGTTAAGIGNATAYYEQHWDTWITEADFQKMASIGINTVRIPIGYWSVGPYFTQNSSFEPWADVYYYSWRYVVRAINWAAKYDIGVLVDLHGAYGSQNGQDHGGLSNGVIDFYNAKNMGLTTDLLVWLTGQLDNVTNIVGIQLLNEPQNRASLWPWYTSTMNAMRKVSASIPLYFHDAFNGAQGAAFVAGRQDFVVQDHHSYYVYTSSDVAESVKGHISDISGSIKTQYTTQSNTARRNLIQGEWSCALAPNSLAQAVNQTFAQTNFCTDQASVYRATSAGFMFWSWTMNSCSNNGGWCFQQAIKTYLPSSFDSWGLVNVTAPMMNLKTTATSGLSNLVSQIGQLALPTYSASLYTNKAIKTSRVAKPAEVARIGMIGEGSHKLVKASGSLASRANEIVQLEKRASSTSAYATASGWSDGFKSAQIFASQGEVVKSDASAYNATFISGIQAAEKLVAQAISQFTV